MNESDITAAIKAASPEALSRYNLDPKFLDFNTMKSRNGSIQVNMGNMKETRPSDEDKSRFLLTVLDICKEAGIPLQVSHGGKKTVTLEGGKVETFWSCWPSLWLNEGAGASEAAKAEAAALKNEVGELRGQLAQMLALMQSQQAATATPAPAPVVGNPIP
jgi:hypothetical protein